MSDDQVQVNEVDAAGTVEVPARYPTSQYVCPRCGRSIPNRQVKTLSRPPRYLSMLNMVLHCPFLECGHYWAPRMTALEGGLLQVGGTVVRPARPGHRWTCPNCGKVIPTDRLNRIPQPPDHAGDLEALYRCPYCAYIFSPSAEAAVVLLRG